MFSTIKLSKDGTGERVQMLYAASTMGDMFVVDVRSGEVVKGFKGHAATINFFVEVKQREWIVTAGDDNQCNVF